MILLDYGTHTEIGGLTLPVLAGISDADPQLAAVGVEPHDTAVGRGAGQGLELTVRARDAVKSLRDICCTLQQHVLREGER